jgi:DNA-binding response OmpR family regulator
MLERAGYEVTVANTISAAREIAARQQLDLVISDVGLPDGSGLELMRELHEKERLTGIALSGFGTDEDTAASRAAGFAEHLTKPVDWERLRSAIERVAQTAGRDELSPA